MNKLPPDGGAVGEPADETEGGDCEEEEEPEPEEEEDVLIEDVDGQHTVHVVVMHLLYRTPLHCAPGHTGKHVDHIAKTIPEEMRNKQNQ